MQNLIRRRVVASAAALSLGVFGLAAVSAVAPTPALASSSACTISEDASTPAIATVTDDTTGPLTSASFSPPAGSLLVAMVNVTFRTSPNTPTITISDSAGGTWTQGPSISDGEYDGSAIFEQYESSAPGTITVTANDSNHAQQGMQLAVRVVDGAAADQSSAGQASQNWSGNSGYNDYSSITTTQAGSWVYVASGWGSNDSDLSAISGTTTVQDYVDNPDVTNMLVGKQSSATGTPGSENLGWTDSTYKEPSSWVAQEVIPASNCGGGCSLSVDASTPAIADSTGNTSGTLTSASFSPPAGSLLVAIANVTYKTSGNSPSISISDSKGGTWTEGPNTNDGQYDGSAIFEQYLTSAPGSMTVTLSNSNHSQAGYSLAVEVIDGASSNQADAGQAADNWNGNSGPNDYVDLTTTTPGSLVFFGSGWGTNGTAMTAASGTTTLQDDVDNTDVTQLLTGESSSVTTDPGPTSFGWSDSSRDAPSSWVGQEVVPAYGCGGGSPTAPSATTNAASGVSSTGADLNGSVNPNGSATTYQFQYGTTTSYGSEVPVPAVDAGAGTSAVSESAAVSGLTASTTYHYRIVATNAGGTTDGSDQSFTTSAASGGTAPAVATGASSNVTSSSATVAGTVNPEGAATTYQFDYGTTTSYGSSVPSPAGSAGSSTSTESESATISGLAASTTYHYRIEATNATGTTYGSDATFTTAAAKTGACNTDISKGQTLNIEGGDYILQTNEFNSSAPLTLCTDGNPDFRVTQSGVNTGSNKVGAYPSIYKGDHWGKKSVNSGLPLLTSTVEEGGKVTTSVVTTPISSGSFDDAYDIFWATCSTCDQTSSGTIEMMIWLTHNGSNQPIGSKVATATIDGISWNIWFGGRTVSYWAASPITSVSNLDLAGFASNAVSRGYISSSDYLIDVEHGFELWNVQNPGLGDTSFQVCTPAGC